jgi:predicted dehydrogenase
MSDYLEISRRRFLARAALAAAAGTRVLGANDRIQIGVIGVGGRGNLLIDQLPKPGQLVALADCCLARCEEAVGKRSANWDIYQDYRRILDRKDIDAVIVATEDHARVIPCIHACQAGKDVYAEKPLTLYPGEGSVLVRAARKYKSVFQVGSQQRSMEMNQIACRLVRSGGLGKVKLAQGINYPDAVPIPDLAEEPTPQELDWNVWQGQARARAYNKKLRFEWMRYQDYSGGETTNWGAHGIDQIQWALGMDGAGPLEFRPMEDPQGAMAFRYANGVEVHLDLPYPAKGVEEPLMGGGRFIGEKGSIDIWRNNFKIDAPGIDLELPPQEEIEKWHDKRALWQAEYHMGFWLGCIATREKPNADVEIGHRSVSVCHLANIARRLNRKIQWDPEKEEVVGDQEANLLAVDRPRRKGWELPKL